MFGLAKGSRTDSRRTTRSVAVAESNALAGYALVLYPPRSKLARLYSIAVAPHAAGRGIGPRLLAAAEDAANRQRRRAMRREVHEHNTRAIARYEKSGYRLFGRHRDYYDDHGDALRFEKPLDAAPRSAATAPGKGFTRAGVDFDGGKHRQHSRYPVCFRL